MGQILSTTMERESKRSGFEEILTAEQLIGSLGGKRPNVMIGSVFNNGEIITIERGLCRLAKQPIGNGDPQFRLVCETSAGVVRNVFPTMFYKSRRLWDSENNCPGETINNYACQVAKFYEKMPSVLAFVASIIGHKIKIDTAGERLAVCGYDPSTNRMSVKAEDVVNARIPMASFLGEEPVFNPEWADELKAAEYIISKLGPIAETAAETTGRKKNA